MNTEIYIKVYGGGDWYIRDRSQIYPQPAATFFIIPDEGMSLCQQWYNVSDWLDHHIGGVLADWLEEHRHLLVVADNTDPDVANYRLTKMIDRLRRKFNELNPDNQIGILP